MAEGNEERLAAIKYLADQLGVNPGDQSIAIATNKRIAKVRMNDGSLEATISPSSRGPIVHVESPRSPGIWIQLVDHLKDPSAPKGAIYEIQAYIPKDQGCEMLNGDIYSIYVGRRGLIFDDPGRRRAAELSRD